MFGKLSIPPNFTFWLLVPLVSLFIWLIRSTGSLEYFELAALDKFFQLRPVEPVAEKIVIVSLKEKDVEEVGYPIREDKLLEVLRDIKKQDPAVIGLNLVRDSVSNEFSTFLETTPNLIGTEQLVPSVYGSFKPIPILKKLGRNGGTILAIDRVDGRIRRGYLYTHPLDGSPQSNVKSFSWAIASKYLKQRGIKAKSGKDGWMQLKEVWFARFDGSNGGYVTHQDDAYSILINWVPIGSFPQFSVTDVLGGRLNENELKNKIVIVDSQTVGTGLYAIPYSGKDKDYKLVPASVIHANVINHILAAVLEHRPIIWTLSESEEFLLILGCLSLLAILIYFFRNKKPWVLASAALSASTLLVVAVLVIDFGVFTLWGGWLPLIPPLLGICILGVGSTGFLYSQNLKMYINHLEMQLRNNLNLSALQSELELRAKSKSKSRSD